MMRTTSMTKLRFLATTAIAALTATAATAQIHTLPARGVPANPSTFSLIFGDGGYRTDANIGITELTLEIDPTAGTAAFTDYYQRAGSLTLPTATPGVFVETGDLTIEILPGTSSGTYDPATGEFVTTDLYAVYFTGDLSVFGIESPFVLPGESTGHVDDASGTYSEGSITMLWDGQGALPPGSDQAIPFTYECSVAASYSSAFGCAQQYPCPGDVNQDCSVEVDDLALMLSHFGERGFLVTRRHGDVNADTSVDLTDLGLFLGSYGTNCD